MWSRGLGKQNLGIDLSKTTPMTLDEALDFMMNEAKGPMLQEIKSQNVICLSGKILPPTGWEFVIVFELKDIFTVAWKLASWKTIKTLFLNSVTGFFGKNKRPLFRSNTNEN